jgi:hypothetical protein
VVAATFNDHDGLRPASRVQYGRAMRTLTTLALLVSLAGVANAKDPTPLPDYGVGSLPSDATDFSQCRYFYQPDLKNPTSDWDGYINVDDSTDSTPHPFDVQTYHYNDRRWLWISVEGEVDLYNYVAGSGLSKWDSLPVQGKAMGMDLNLNGTRKKLYVATHDDDSTPAIATLTVFSFPTGAANDWQQDGVADLTKPAPQVFGDSSTNIPACNDGDPPGTIDVVVNSAGTLAYVTNECNKSSAGSIDVVSLTTFTVLQRIRVDGAPVGLAFGPNESTLLVTEEHVGAYALQKGHGIPAPGNTGKYVGAMMVFSITPGLVPLYHPFLTLIGAVNAGCAPVRVVVDGSHRAWLTSRWSNDVMVFDADKLGSGQVDQVSTSRLAFFQVGPEPVGLKIIDGGQALAVANSFRTDDNDAQHHDGVTWAKYPKPSISIYKISDISFTQPTVRQWPGSCHAFATPDGYGSQPDGDFPRNIAGDDENIYVSIWGGGKVERISMNYIGTIVGFCDY